MRRDVDKKTSKNRSTPLFSSVVILNVACPPRRVKHPSAFSNNQQPLLCVGFFVSLTQNDALTNVILNAVKDSSAFSNNQQSLLCVGFFLAYRQAGLPAVGGPAYHTPANAQNDALTNVILNAVKDPSAFSIMRLSLHCMGFFVSLRMTKIKYLE